MWVRLTQSCTLVHAAQAFLISIETQLSSSFLPIYFQFSRISLISAEKRPSQGSSLLGRDRIGQQCSDWVCRCRGRSAAVMEPTSGQRIYQGAILSHTNTVIAEIIFRGVISTRPNEWESAWKEVSALEICKKYFHRQPSESASKVWDLNQHRRWAGKNGQGPQEKWCRNAKLANTLQTNGGINKTALGYLVIWFKYDFDCRLRSGEVQTFPAWPGARSGARFGMCSGRGVLFHPRP